MTFVLRDPAIRARPRARSGEEAMHRAHDFEEYVARVRSRVDARLAEWLGGRVAAARSRGADVAAVAEAVAELALRGGKRMRAVLLACAYDACRGQGGADRVTMAGVALELLQAYLLVHDDWMDGDDVRRGGPSVPAMMRARLEAHADSASVLAGDLAAAWAQAALFEVDADPARVVGAAREMARVQEEVVQGQVLDVRGAARDRDGVEAMHALKTASYTTCGPVVMGARLAGAADAVVEALAACARPLGVAFQLRDDVLGVFGDARATGKPAGADLRAGKRTSVVVEAAGEREVDAVLGRRDASEADVRVAVARLDSCGARERIEARIAALVSESRAALARADVTAEGRALFDAAIVALTERDR